LGTTAGHGTFVKIGALIALYQTYGIYWFGNGWTFFPNVDIPGGDIGNFPSAVGNPTVSTQSSGECIAFNTNGWLKRTAVSKSQFAKWTSNGYEGSFTKSAHTEAQQSVKSSAFFVITGNWVFLPYVDSPGNDIRQNTSTDNWKALLDDASNDSSVVAVNTTGWMKRSLVPRSQWSRWTSNAFQGLWVRLSAFTGVLANEGCDWAGTGWTFFANKDSGGNDLGRASGLDFPTLFTAANSDTRVVCFNTNGFLKTAVVPRSTWGAWGGAGDGLFVRNANIPSS